MRIEPKFDAADVVLIGRFNPVIFQPQWFARTGLITAEMADEADAVAVEIIAAPATTVMGAYAQIALLNYWAENSVPDRAEAALGRLHNSIETALQGAAKGGAA